MNVIARRTAFTIGAGCFMLTMGAIGGLVAYYNSPRSPVLLKDVHEVSHVVYRGKAIVLDFTLTRLVLCDSKVDRWLWKHDDAGDPHWVGIPARSNPPTPLGVETHYRLSLPVPIEVTAGPWFYFSRSWDECPGPFGLTFRTTRDSGNIPIEIADPPTTAPTEIITTPGPVMILPGVK